MADFDYQFYSSNFDSLVVVHGTLPDIWTLDESVVLEARNLYPKASFGAYTVTEKTVVGKDAEKTLHTVRERHQLDIKNEAIREMLISDLRDLKASKAAIHERLLLQAILIESDVADKKRPETDGSVAFSRANLILHQRYAVESVFNIVKQSKNYLT